MQVHISIGENHRFELREALLVYGDRQGGTIAPLGEFTIPAADSLTFSLIVLPRKWKKSLISQTD
jgi:hypothetical protein